MSVSVIMRFFQDRLHWFYYLLWAGIFGASLFFFARLDGAVHSLEGFLLLLLTVLSITPLIILPLFFFTLLKTNFINEWLLSKLREQGWHYFFVNSLLLAFLIVVLIGFLAASFMFSDNADDLFFLFKNNWLILLISVEFIFFM